MADSVIVSAHMRMLLTKYLCVLAARRCSASASVNASMILGGIFSLQLSEGFFISTCYRPLFRRSAL